MVRIRYSRRLSPGLGTLIGVALGLLMLLLVATGAWAKPTTSGQDSITPPNTLGNNSKAPAASVVGPRFAVWLDGDTTPGGGGNGIPSSLTNAFGAGSFDLVSTSQLETAGFLNNYDAVIISRYDSYYGNYLSQTVAANIAAYVGSGELQGGVAIFTNDAADNFFGATTGDPYDANLDRLFINAATYTAATHHGYIGEFNGAVMAMSSNTAGVVAIGLLPGSANAVHSTSTPNGNFIYNVGPIGANHPIDYGVYFPFTDVDTSLFRTDITGADNDAIVDVFADNGLPAVMANAQAVHGIIAINPMLFLLLN